MIFQTIPLIYAANEQFKNTIRFAVEFNEEINPDSLAYAVRQVQKRFPYFSEKSKKTEKDLFWQKTACLLQLPQMKVPSV